MASFINSIRNMTSDSWWFIKLSFFSYVVFVLLDQAYYHDGNPVYMFAYVLVTAIGLGCATILMHRNIHNIDPIFPSFLNLFDILIKTIGSTVIALPGTVIFLVCLNLLYDNFEFDPIVGFIIYMCVLLFFAPFILIPLVLYSVKGKFSDAFRMNVIYEASGNFVVQFATYILQYLFIAGFATWVVYTVIWEMLGDHVGLLILKCVLIAITFFSVFSFASDLYEDVIPELKDVKRKRNP